MAKRLTKAQRTEREIAALERRLVDMWMAATGSDAVIDGEGTGDPVFGTLDAPAMSRLVRAVDASFSWQMPGESYRATALVKPVNLDEYDDPATLAAWMHQLGFRA